MAEQTKYTIEEVIALPKGTTPWYDQNQDAYRHIKNTMDTIADISGGGEPGFGSPIDVRGYVQDSSNSTKDYTGVTRPAASQGDYMPAGYAIIFDADRPNTGAATLNLGSGDGAVPIFQYSERNEKVDPVQGAIIGPTLMVFDGSHWVLDKSALPGPPGPEGEDGPAGIGIYVKGSVSTESNLPQEGNTVGDAYFTEDDNHIHVWTEEGEWYDRGPTQIEFPLDLSKNNLGDLGDVQLSSEDDGDVLGFNGVFWDSVLIDSHNITDYGIENVDLNSNIVDDRVLDSNGDFNPKGQWNFGQDILVGGKPIKIDQPAYTADESAPNGSVHVDQDGKVLMNTLKVNRIEPRTGDTLEIFGFSYDQPYFMTSMPNTGNQTVSQAVRTKVSLSGAGSVQMPGGFFDPDGVLDANGSFTATEETAGVWQFYAQVSGSVQDGSQDLNEVYAHLMVNGSIYDYSEGVDNAQIDNTRQGVTQPVGFITRVDAGDTVELYATVSYAKISELYVQMRGTNFSGHRISL